MTSSDNRHVIVFNGEIYNYNDLKFPQLGKPLRYALTGRTNAPGLGELLYLLGNEESRKRIKNYLE